jgi:hypothetical protein
MNPSPSHLVLIPSYNPGPKVYETVAAARAQWAPVWVVVDGSSDVPTSRIHDSGKSRALALCELTHIIPFSP